MDNSKVNSQHLNTLKLKWTYFNPILHFDIPWKRKKTVFMMCSRGTEMEHWAKIETNEINVLNI